MDLGIQKLLSTQKCFIDNLAAYHDQKLVAKIYTGRQSLCRLNKDSVQRETRLVPCFPLLMCIKLI